MTDPNKLSNYAWACGEHIGFYSAAEKVLSWAVEAAKKTIWHSKCVVEVKR